MWGGGGADSAPFPLGRFSSFNTLAFLELSGSKLKIKKNNGNNSPPPPRFLPISFPRGWLGQGAFKCRKKEISA